MVKIELPQQHDVMCDDSDDDVNCDGGLWSPNGLWFYLLFGELNYKILSIYYCYLCSFHPIIYLLKLRPLIFVWQFVGVHYSKMYIDGTSIVIVGYKMLFWNFGVFSYQLPPLRNLCYDKCISKLHMTYIDGFLYWKQVDIRNSKIMNKNSMGMFHPSSQ